MASDRIGSVLWVMGHGACRSADVPENPLAGWGASPVPGAARRLPVIATAQAAFDDAALRTITAIGSRRWPRWKFASRAMKLSVIWKPRLITSRPLVV